MAAFDAHCVTKEDNVAIVVRDVTEGETVAVHVGTEILKIAATTAIPAGHKIALRDFKKDESVLKYGEAIGVASTGITTGAHVHIHNLEGLRGRGDKL